MLNGNGNGIKKKNGRKGKSFPAKSCQAQFTDKDGLVKYCGKKFIPYKGDQIYCSQTCNNREMQRRLRARGRMGIREMREAERA